jgi:hypothetical protein
MVLGAGHSDWLAGWQQDAARKGIRHLQVNMDRSIGGPEGPPACNPVRIEK